MDGTHIYARAHTHTHTHTHYTLRRALHFAADKSYAMVHALLDAGADPLLRTKAKVAAIHLTAQYV